MCVFIFKPLLVGPVLGSSCFCWGHHCWGQMGGQAALLPLAILGVATLDFLVGTFANSDDGKKNLVYFQKSFSNLTLNFHI